MTARMPRSLACVAFAAALFLESHGAASLRAQTSPPHTTLDMQMLAIQVALDRAGFSPGVIDGRPGTNTQRAMDAYRQQHGQDVAPASDPTTPYEITAQDAAGPFATSIPTDLIAQAQLPALAYRSIEEAIAERFHTTPDTIARLNPDVTIEAGATILVPAVEPMTIPAEAPTQTFGTAAPAQPTGTSGPAGLPQLIVRVSRTASAVSVADADGKVIFFAPVTTGSDKDPLPIGEWTVNGVQYNPPFHYNPELFWDADPSHTKARLPPGPNGPVGVAWIDISKEHYGLHGSPEPSQIGRTASHGCVRLTNWDVLRLAKLVSPGTRVIFSE